VPMRAALDSTYLFAAVISLTLTMQRQCQEQPPKTYSPWIERWNWREPRFAEPKRAKKVRGAPGSVE